MGGGGEGGREGRRGHKEREEEEVEEGQGLQEVEQEGVLLSGPRSGPSEVVLSQFGIVGGGDADGRGMDGICQKICARGRPQRIRSKEAAQIVPQRVVSKGETSARLAIPGSRHPRSLSSASKVSVTIPSLCCWSRLQFYNSSLAPACGSVQTLQKLH